MSQKKTYDIAIRGHHLDLIWKLFFSRQTFGGVYFGILRNLIIQDLEFKLGAHGSKKVLETLDKIKSKQNIRVKITSSINDFICAKCSQKNSSYCAIVLPEKDDDDFITAKFYELQVSKIYSSKYIIKKLKERGCMEWKNC